MLRILVAADSFKGSLGQHAVCRAIGQGLNRGFSEPLAIDLCPLADGGEGTGALFERAGGQPQPVAAVDAYGRPSEAHWTLFQGVALVEAAVGSPYVAPDMRPAGALTATSRGTGQIIRAALNDSRVSEVWVALGGTGSVDGGFGLLAELGARFYDARGALLRAGTEAWTHVRRAEVPALKKPVVALADVWVPLLGDDGALHRFGPQKGLDREEIEQSEPRLAAFADVVAPAFKDSPGAGAAGGMGFALAALGARLERGAEWMARWSGLDERVKGADVVITGEGRLDSQSLLGKVVSVVLDYAKPAHKPVIVLAGQIPDDLAPFYDRGMSAALSIASGPLDAAAAYRRTGARLAYTAESVGRMLAMLRDLDFPCK